MPFNEILRFLRAYPDQLTLSSAYIAKIFQEVSRTGFAAAMPGPRGGYGLAKPAEEIRLSDVVRALDGPAFTECCLLAVGACPPQPTCGFRQVIQNAGEAFERELEKETVASVAAKIDFGNLTSSGAEAGGAQNAALATTPGLGLELGAGWGGSTPQL